MKSKIEKYLKYVAAAVFVATLTTNVVVTSNDPFVLLSDAMADTTTNSTIVNTTSTVNIIELPTGQLCIDDMSLCNLLIPEPAYLLQKNTDASIKIIVSQSSYEGDAEYSRDYTQIGIGYICKKGSKYEWCNPLNQLSI